MGRIESPHCELALSELLDRILNRGVVIVGDLTISIADVDLIYVGLKVLLSSVETAEQLRSVPKPHKGEADHALPVCDH
ncbi:MAG: gas vesicle protein [Alphaproteobacteria bacterium]